MELLQNFSNLEQFYSGSGLAITVGLLTLAGILYRLARRLTILIVAVSGLPALLGLQTGNLLNWQASPGWPGMSLILAFFILGLFVSRPFRSGAGVADNILSILVLMLNFSLAFMAYYGMHISFAQLVLAPQVLAICVLAYTGAALLMACIRAAIGFIPVVFWASCAGVALLLLAPAMPTQLVQQTLPVANQIGQLVDFSELKQFVPTIVEVVSGFATNQK